MGFLAKIAMEELIINVEYKKGDKLIGHVEICSNKENAKDSLIWISDLFVAEACRHTGIGTKLMNMVIDAVKKLSIPKVYLFCKPDLIPFYKRFGAEDTHQKKNGYNLMMINNN